MLQNGLILSPCLRRTRLVFTLERDEGVEFRRINAAHEGSILVNSTTTIRQKVGTGSNDIRNEHDDDARWHRSAHDREGPSFEMESSWVAVHRYRPWGALAEQLHVVTAIEPLYCFRHSQRNLGVAAAFTALGTLKVYVHTNDIPSVSPRASTLSAASKVPTHLADTLYRKIYRSLPISL